jgi:carboxypeptidase Taq
MVERATLLMARWNIAEAWRAAMQTDLGVGYIGGRFQSYTMGNILSAQFYAAALKANPDIPCEISSGEFGTLHTWLRDSVYQHGSKFAPNHLIERAAGAAMNMTPYFDYLREKYAALYRLPVSIGGDSGTLPSLL